MRDLALNQKGIPLTSWNRRFFNSPFIFSLLQSMFLTLFTELGENSFIFFFLSQLRTSKLASCLLIPLSLILVTGLSALIGFIIEFILPQTIVTILGLLCLIIYGIKLLIDSYKMTAVSLEEKISLIIRNDLAIIRENKNDPNFVKSVVAKPLSVIDECGSESSMSELSEPLLEKNGEDNVINRGDYQQINYNQQITNNRRVMENYKIEFVEQYKNFNWINYQKLYLNMLKDAFIYEAFNSTQIGIISMTAIFESFGVVIGSLTGILVIFNCAIFLGNKIFIYLNEKTLKFLSGFIFIFFALEIISILF